MAVESYFLALLPMLAAGLLFWLLSLIRDDVSIVDSLWGLFFIIACGWFFISVEQLSTRAWIVLILVTIWGTRLSAYITLRKLGQGEDARYRAIRDNYEPGFRYKSLYLIFVFQALVAWIIALPLFHAIDSGSELGVFDFLGITLWCIGMWFESLGDYQLWQFKRRPENRGKIMTEGLWRYTRHPNYFGEFLIWWGYFSFALSDQAYWAILSPLLMTFLLLKFSGVGRLEDSMQHRPGYRQYMQTTNAFLPGIPARKVN